MWSSTSSVLAFLFIYLINLFISFLFACPFISAIYGICQCHGFVLLYRTVPTVAYYARLQMTHDPRSDPWRRRGELMAQPETSGCGEYILVP